MPVQLGVQHAADHDDPIGWLCDCHRRIEGFLNAMVRAVDAGPSNGALTGETRRALATALRYFESAAPRHIQDEEESLFPRVAGAAAPNVREAIEAILALESDHREAEALQRRVNGAIRRWLDAGVLGCGEREALAEDLRALQDLYAEHIRTEEVEVFPLASTLLGREMLRAVGREMARRRGFEPIANDEPGTQKARSEHGTPEPPGAEPTSASDDRRADDPFAHAPAEPFGLLERWLEEARQALRLPHQWNVLMLATSDESGAPNVRPVLLKGFDPITGRLTFYTNYRSPKAREIECREGRVAGVLHWDDLGRYVRVQGIAHRAPSTASDAYFAQRDRESRLGAWASDQSEPLADRETLVRQLDATRRAYEGREAVPRPEHWGGFVIAPDVVEFWQAAPARLHARLVYQRAPDTSPVWSRSLLYP